MSCVHPILLPLALPLVVALDLAPVAARAQATPVPVAASDSARFLSLYERVAARARREPGLLAEHPVPAEQLASVRWMTGTWICEARVFATPTTPARSGRAPEVSTYAIASDGDVQRITRDSSGATSRTLKLRYDARTARWIFPVVSRQGYGILSAPGWRGDTVTFRGPMTIMGEPVDLRQTWARTSDTTYTILNEELPPRGEAVALDAYSCTRLPPASP